MDAGSWSSPISIGMFVAGFGLGVAAGFFANPARARAKLLRAELDRALQEHQDYKSSVSTHFRKTADLVGQMTRSYAAVYDHLAGGARTFCDDSAAGTKIPFGPLPGELAAPVIETSVAEAPPSVDSAEAVPAADPDGARTAAAPDSRQATAAAALFADFPAPTSEVASPDLIRGG